LILDRSAWPVLERGVGRLHIGWGHRLSFSSCGNMWRLGLGSIVVLRVGKHWAIKRNRP
jgi:hypothetical protein